MRMEVKELQFIIDIVIKFTRTSLDLKNKW